MQHPRLAAAAAASALLGHALTGGAADVRVAKGMYNRGYGMVRLSVMGSEDATEGPAAPLAYQAPFKHRWEGKTLASEVRSVPPEGLSVSLGGQDWHLPLLPEGAPATGLLMADPCFTGRGGVACPSEQRNMLGRMTRLLNHLIGNSADFHFWGLLGDNFYDQQGEVSSEFFDRLTNATKSKPLLAVPGNHDFWVGGYPPGGAGDQLGYGFMQFYGQDTVAGLRNQWEPYDFSSSTNELPAAENFIFGTQIGDMAFFGYSGAHSWAATEPHARDFCMHAGATATIRTVLLLGHWSAADFGCEEGMDVPSVYGKMKFMPGCAEKRLLYFEGHWHCNRVAEWSTGPDDAVGFIVGGAGMHSATCREVGFTVVQSVPDAPGGPNVRVDYFPLMNDRDDRFDDVMACFAEHAYTFCRQRYAVGFRTVGGDDGRGAATELFLSSQGRVLFSWLAGSSAASADRGSAVPVLATVAAAVSMLTAAKLIRCAQRGLATSVFKPLSRMLQALTAAASWPPGYTPMQLAT